MFFMVDKKKYRTLREIALSAKEKIMAEHMKDESDRDAGIHKTYVDYVMGKLKLCVRSESRNGKLPLFMKEKYLITSEEYLNKSFVRISMGNLYRRYRQIRLQALIEVLGIANIETNQNELCNQIRALVIECGKPQKQSKELYNRGSQLIPGPLGKVT